VTTVCGGSNGIADREPVFKKICGGLNKKDYWEAIFERFDGPDSELARIAALSIAVNINLASIYNRMAAGLGWKFAHMLVLKMKVQRVDALYMTIMPITKVKCTAHATHLVGSALSDPYLSFAAV